MPVLFSQTALARSVSPTFPPVLRYVTVIVSHRWSWSSLISLAIQVRGDSCGVETLGRNGQGAAEVNHTGYGTAVDDV